MILNLTQHIATAEQVADGVVEPDDKKLVQVNLTFEEIPDPTQLAYCAGILAQIAQNSGAKKAMIGGAPYLMAPLEQALCAYGVSPVYSFTRRETVEEKLPDGGIKKTQVFRHAGWVEVADFHRR